MPDFLTPFLYLVGLIPTQWSLNIDPFTIVAGMAGAIAAYVSLRLKSGMASLRMDLQEEMSGLRSEAVTGVTNLRTEVTRDIGSLRNETVREIGQIRSEIVKSIDGSYLRSEHAKEVVHRLDERLENIDRVLNSRPCLQSSNVVHEIQQHVHRRKEDRQESGVRVHKRSEDRG